MNIILYDEKKIEAYNWEGVFTMSIYILVKWSLFQIKDRGETKNIANSTCSPNGGKLQAIIGQTIKRKKFMKLREEIEPKIIQIEKNMSANIEVTTWV